jgi:hypothetical protein
MGEFQARFNHPLKLEGGHLFSTWDDYVTQWASDYLDHALRYFRIDYTVMNKLVYPHSPKPNYLASNQDSPPLYTKISPNYPHIPYNSPVAQRPKLLSSYL